jgi:hypothetical protein
MWYMYLLDRKVFVNIVSLRGLRAKKKEDLILGRAHGKRV